MRTRKLSAMSVGVASAVLALTAFTSGADATSATTSTKTIPILTIGAAPFSTLNYYTDNASGYFYIQMLYETLVDLGTNGQFEPALATSWSQPKPTEYIFHLRQGVKFWDGSTMTSADVVASLNEWKNPTSADDYYFTGDTFTADGPYTVVATIPKPEAWAFSEIANGAEISEKKFLLANWTKFGLPGTGGQPAGIMATGPWEVKSFDPTKGMVLTANPYYRQKVNIKQIDVDFFSTPESEALAMRTGQVALAPYITDPQAFEHISGVKVEGSNGCSTNDLSFNTALAPFNNVHVRLAIADVLNRADIIDAWGGFAYPTYTWIPQRSLESLGSVTAVTKFVDSLPTYRYAGDLKEAKLQMSKSPYPKGFSTTITTFSYTYLNTTAASEVIAAELKPLGITATVKTLDLSTYLADFTAPANRPAMTFGNYGCADLNPALDQQLSSELGTTNTAAGGYNVSNWNPPSVDTLITEGATAKTPAVALAAYENLSRLLAADMPYVALTEQGNVVAISTKYTWPTYTSWYTSGPPYPLAVEYAH
jgi:peptide/nickel transport system substrate-binding protein